MHLPFRLPASAAAALLVSHVSAALPVTEGLLLHVDAALQPGLRMAAALPPVSRGQPVDLLLDAGPAGRRFSQPRADPRPLWQSNGAGVAYLLFDGNDDFLSSSEKAPLPAAVTVFLVAAVDKNPGMFRALFSTAVAGQNDFTSGLNIDLGEAATEQMSFINVESAGADGAQDLLTPGEWTTAADLPFGEFHVFTLRSHIAPKGCELRIDSIPVGSRDRLESHIGLDGMVLGARLYSHDPAQPPHVQNFLPGRIAQVLVYGRDLPDNERDAVENWLMEKLPPLNALASGAAGHSLEVLKDAPPLQMLVPGFSVSELPVKLTNRNNLRYRHDGKLVALGYDGTIHLLTDTDGDGLEDKADAFWEKETMRGPVGIALLPKDDPRGDGVFVASKGKVSLILDKDRDGKADEEIIAATGWEEIPQSVDAVGMAVDPRDGSLWFCLGCANYANAYLIDRATGKAAYDVNSDRGTIQRVSADFKKRETVCTGVRFACALAFNEHGDLFATEQEGATWLPDGNALDELLHIQPGKHYGFPPRHPKHLPDVLDWPAVVEYGPQHQSTVGMVFNTGVNGGPHFGPDTWKGDALVCGEARGKIWRTKLVRTQHGYVGQNHLIACLGLLTVDACVSPQGDMLVACHTGPPDWGTGPKGEGRIFKVKYTGRDVPQPVWAWASAPDEFTIAFDKELQPEEWSNRVAQTTAIGGTSDDRPLKEYPVLTASSAVAPHPGKSESIAFMPIGTTVTILPKKAVRIEAGRHVSAGDRFETIRPGYQVVRDQMGAPRRNVKVLGLSLSGDRRNIVLKIPRQTEPVGYAVTLPLPDTWVQQSPVPQKPDLDVLVTLNGTRLHGVSGERRKEIVLPSVDTAAAAAFLAGSALHDRFWTEAAAEKPETGLTSFLFDGRYSPDHPFIPRVQSGAVLDWNPQDTLGPVSYEMVTPWMVVPFRPNPVTGFPGQPIERGALGGSIRAMSLHMYHRQSLPSGGIADHWLPVPLDRFLLPWAGKADEAAATKAAVPLPGDWLAGRHVFFSHEAACFTCHQIRGQGLAVGPDLTNLISRDGESVLKDILEPSAAINPDHPASTVKLKSGHSLTGIVRKAGGETLEVAQPGGAVQTLNAADVLGTELLRVSFMPQDYAKRLTKEQQQDLLAFLLTNPLEPAPVERQDPPPPAPRKWSGMPEALRDVMNRQPGDAARARPLRVLLSAGPKDHGPGEHDYPLWQKRWTTLLGMAPGVTVANAWEFPRPEQLAEADVTVFFSRNQGWGPRAAQLLDEYQERGGGLVYIHWAVEGGKDAELLAERIGLASDAAGTKYRHGGFDLIFPAPEHPVTKDFPTLHFTDETYWSLRGNESRLRVLGTVVEEGSPRTELWSMERKKGRVVGCVPGHYTWTFDDPLFRVLVLRSICWASKQEDADRLSMLATPGARIVW
ncbi:MAG: ThuA domain-containing protein [Verrucomicrobiales bacterium]